MKTHTNAQILMQEGKPAFAVIPYKEYLRLLGREERYIPNEVVGLCIKKGMSLLAAWRTYKGLSQTQLAEAIGISQSAVAQLEKEGVKPRKLTLKKIAEALEVDVEQITE
ncbi:MAG: helix-turn-helix transcriptional regulator [Candidatus Cloacimonetes bacterium]|nr:helix-turn-helix transcriptional regulator [Candidatus Cloacimonadota bacterium]